MPGLQELIHKWDVGEGTKIIKKAALGLVLLTLVIWYDFHEYKNFTCAEAMDAAQVARNLSAGRGFTTDCIRPFSLYLIKQQHPDEPKLLLENPPDLTNPPLYPLLLAGLMKLPVFNFSLQNTDFRYQPELLIMVFNQLWFLAAILLAFFLTKRLFDASVAWLTAGVMIGSDLLWRFSVSGLSTLMLMVIGLGVTWCLVRIEQGTREDHRSPRWFILWAVAVGVLVGLGALTRYSFAWMILPVVAFLALYTGPRRAALIIAAIIAFLVVMSPWLIRNYQLSGTLFGTAGFATMQDTPRLPGNTLERLLKPDFNQLHQTGFSDYLRKLLVNASQVFQNDLPRFGGTWLSAFFLVGLLVPFKNPTLGRLRLFLLASIGLMIGVQALGRTHLSTDIPEINSENLLVLFMPPVLAFGACLFFLLLDRLELPLPQLRQWLSTAAGLLACAPLLFTLLPPRSYAMAYPPYHPWLVQHLGGWYKEKELIMSDMPWAMAWYGHRPCVWLTLDYKNDFYAINDFIRPVNALYITQLTMDTHFQSQFVEQTKTAPWGRFILEVLLKHSVPTGFPLKNAWSNVLPDQIFLTDWERWNSPSAGIGKK